MFLRLWQFFRGYVAVEVTGFAVERFLNMAAFRGVYLWDVVRRENGVTMKVTIPGFKLLRGCARKTRCRVRIRNKRGYPFIYHRYRRRKVLWGGVIFFVMALYALSSFIWRIDVVGRERLEQEDILAFCESQGLKVGAFKYGVNHRQLQRDLQTHFSDIGWADVHTRGTRTTVTISETIPARPVVDKETPCNIVAAKDGLITGIVTGSGKPLVRQHDVVKQGEVLVSGVLELNSDTQGISAAYVHAYAEVWAKRFTPIQFTVPFNYTVKQYTGNSETRYEIRLLFAGDRRIRIPGSSVKFDSYDKMTNHWQPGASGDYPLPFVIIRSTCNEFVPAQRSRGLEEAKELADRMLTGRILREFDFSADIIGKDVRHTETGEGLLVEALITTNERIDAAVPIKPPLPMYELLEDMEVFEPFE